MRDPPFLFGDYEVTGVIAEGGMGVVYRARQRSLGRFVALKMIRSGSFASAEERHRFRTEAEAAATLDHPGIVPIHEVGEIDGQPYFSMRLVEGGSLESRKEAHAGDALWAAAVVEGVARAVHHAHLRGILHRDLKPANVLLEEGDHPVVTDFGLARRLDAAGTRYTVTGMLLGTPAYMAPEQARGEPRAVTTAADVWSLGVLLYELVTGRLPFRGASMVDLLEQLVGGEPDPPSRAGPRIPLDVETICLKCLRKPPTDRYASAADLADDLARFLRGEPVTARPLSTVERAVRWTRRHPTQTAAIVFALVAVVGGLLGLTAYFRLQADTERSNAARAREAARRARAGEWLALARTSSDADAIAQAGLYFAASGRLESSPVARVGIRSHRVPIPLRALPLGSGTIWRIVFDREGRRVAVGTDQGVRIWEPLSGRVVTVTRTPGAQAHGLAFDGARLATGDEAGNLSIWDTTSGERLAGSSGSACGEVSSLAFADGGRFLVIAGGDHRLWLWEIGRSDPRPIAFEPLGPPADASKIRVRYAVADPSGARVLVAARIETGDRHRGEARLFDAASCRFVDGGAEFDGEPWCADFSRDASRIAVSGDLGVCLMEGASGARLGFLPALRPLGAVGFGADSATLLVGNTDGAVMRLDPGTGDDVGQPLPALFATYALAVDPDGRQVLTGGRDGVLRAWAMPSGEPESRVVRGVPDANLAELGRDERYLLTTSGSTLVLTDLDTGRRSSCGPVEGHPSVLGPSGDGWWLVTAQPDRRWTDVRVTADGAPLARVLKVLPPLKTYSSAVAPDDAVYVCSEAGDLTRLAPDGREALVARDVRNFDLSPDGDVLALLDHGPQVRIRRGGSSGSDGPAWQVPQGADTVATDRGGTRFSAGVPSGGWYLFDGATGQQIGPAMVKLDLRHRFSPDGRFLMTGSRKEGWIRFLDAETGRPVGRVLRHFTRDGPELKTAVIGHAAFSMSGRRLVVVCQSEDVHVWNLDWLDERALDAEAEWERAQLAAMRTLDGEGVERHIPVEEWQARRDRWFREHGE